jgi:Tfp pilus assembly protein PilF
MTTARMYRFSRRRILALLLALTCAGCSVPVVNEPAELSKGVAASKNKGEPEPAKEPAMPPQIPTPSKSEQELERGIKSYEEGQYKTAARHLQAALGAGLDAKRDQARAYKYLAFIACVSGREKLCRDAFYKALDADPKLDLEPAEAGHPIWGPVFRSVKAERAAKAKPK